jgi:tetratricopeptide (TPR) repeat protein
MEIATRENAWKAYDQKDFDVAAKLWEQLIRTASSDMERDSFRYDYGYTLVGLKRFDEARSIYEQLYEKISSHIYIHQIGMVEREAGNYVMAAELFKQEQTMLAIEDNLAIAANLYEQALIESLIGELSLAFDLANQCLVVSMTTEDKIMHGCAYRLLGDLLRLDFPDKARIHYYKSRKSFEDAGDQIACGEIDQRVNEMTT